jgi:hypothetical protein
MEIATKVYFPEFKKTDYFKIENTMTMNIFKIRAILNTIAYPQFTL